MAQYLLHRAQGRALGDMVRRKGVSQCVHAGACDADLCQVLGYHLLDRPRAHGQPELGHEQSFTPLRPYVQPCLYRAAGLVVEGDPALFAAFAQNVQTPHRLGVSGDAPRELDVAYLQLGQLGEAHAGLQEQLDDGGIPWMMAAGTQQRLVLDFA